MLPSLELISQAGIEEHLEMRRWVDAALAWNQDPHMPTLTLELPSQKSQTGRNLARWAKVLSDQKLAELEERIETDRFGRIIMMPSPFGASRQLSIQNWSFVGWAHAKRARYYRMPNFDSGWRESG